ncbi:MAG: hypothetical protein SXG53_24825, partial [Pseudomonadota bacterium]|nr:hypothetical protein [Pseudomonadota bacterium]
WITCGSTPAAPIKLAASCRRSCSRIGGRSCSLMGAAGVEPHVIQQVLGHSSAVTTVDTYWQVFRETARAAVNASAKLLRRHAKRRRRLGPSILA